jgi:hypothetical protein
MMSDSVRRSLEMGSIMSAYADIRMAYNKDKDSGKLRSGTWFDETLKALFGDDPATEKIGPRRNSLTTAHRHMFLPWTQKDAVGGVAQCGFADGAHPALLH